MSEVSTNLQIILSTTVSEVSTNLSTNGAILEKTAKWLEDRKKILPTPEEQKQIDKILGETSTEDDSDISIESEQEEDLQEQEEE